MWNDIFSSLSHRILTNKFKHFFRSYTVSGVAPAVNFNKVKFLLLRKIKIVKEESNIPCKGFFPFAEKSGTAAAGDIDPLDIEQIAGAVRRI